MISSFLEKYAKLIASYPQEVLVRKELLSNNTCLFEIFVNSNDVGKLIGKHGKMTNSLVTFLKAWKNTEYMNYKINIKHIE